MLARLTASSRKVGHIYKFKHSFEFDIALEALITAWIWTTSNW
jgi:hypothetical protein